MLNFFPGTPLGKKPVVEVQPEGKHEDSAKEDSDSLSLVKKAKGEEEVEMNERDAPVSIWMMHPNQECLGEGETMNKTADSPGHSSKFPTNPEVFNVWFWRHQLQKAICNDTLPKDKVHIMSLVLSRLMS